MQKIRLCDRLSKPGNNKIYINNNTPKQNVFYVENMIINTIQNKETKDPPDNEVGVDK